MSCFRVWVNIGGFGRASLRLLPEFVHAAESVQAALPEPAHRREIYGWKKIIPIQYIINGLVYGKIYRQGPSLMVKTMVSCKFSHKPMVGV